MNGVSTPLKKNGKTKNYAIIMRKGDKLLHIAQGLMRTPKRDVTAKHMYYLVENFVLSLLTETCTNFGIMEFSLTTAVSSQNLGAWCIKQQRPLFSEPSQS